MTDITFVKTRHVYDSYIDFFHLVKLSGFPIIYVDQVDVSKRGVYIVAPINGEWRPHINNQKGHPMKAHLIQWNLERPAGSGSVGQYAEDNRQLIYDEHIHENWMSDRRLAEQTEARFVVLGSDEGLGEPSKEKKYQLCHMSYETPRRVSIYKHFDKKNIGPNCWPPERDRVLKASKFALNVHQDQYPFQEPLRFALFAAYGLPIVSETIRDAYPWSDEFMVFAGWDGIVGKLNQMLENDYQRWWNLGQKARELMCKEFQFGKVVRQAVKETVGNWR